MNRKGVILITILSVLGVIIVSQLLVSSKLDVTVFTHPDVGAEYDNSNSSTQQSAQNSRFSSKSKLRTGSSTTKNMQSENSNPFSDADFLAACGINEVNTEVVTVAQYSNPFFNRLLPATKEDNRLFIKKSINVKGRFLVGGYRTALVILTQNRAQHLLQTMNRIIDVLSSKTILYTVDVFIAQEGDDSITKNMIAAIIERFREQIPDCQIDMIQQRKNTKEGKDAKDIESKQQIYAANLKNALDDIFNEKKYDQSIFLDDGMIISSDFLDYFSITADILHNDPSVFSISAYNEQGNVNTSFDNTMILRTNYFSSIAWMVSMNGWNEIREKWPEAHWSEWIRTSEWMSKKECIRPEVSRVYLTDVIKYTQEKSMIEVYNKRPIDFLKFDYSYLYKDVYDGIWVEMVENAELVTSVDNLISASINQDVKIVYTKTSGKRSFRYIADVLGIPGDACGGITRTEYLGVTTLCYEGFRLYIVPESGF